MKTVSHLQKIVIQSGNASIGKDLKIQGKIDIKKFDKPKKKADSKKPRPTTVNLTRNHSLKGKANQEKGYCTVTAEETEESKGQGKSKKDEEAQGRSPKRKLKKRSRLQWPGSLGVVRIKDKKYVEITELTRERNKR